MTFTHIDLIGLNKHEMFDAPIVRDSDELSKLAESSKGTHSLSIAGMRHSQGGHTALIDGRMVFTEAMEQRIEVSKDRKTVTINAGATWSDLHFKLGPMGLAPLVHQSSPHFSIGGSLSVDCHGREVREGALSNTVESITILTNKDNKLKETTASRTDKPDLFFAALGGYGACGIILKATIRITNNIRMYKCGSVVGGKYDSAENTYRLLTEYLNSASKGERLKYKNQDNKPQKLRMFYTWMNISQDPTIYLTHAMVYEYVPESEYVLQDNYFYAMKVKELKEEGWATTEVMRAAWVAARRDANLRGELFDIIAQKTKGQQQVGFALINFLREEISFTSTKGDATDVDLLQEFFIPLPRITDFLIALKGLLPIGDPNIQVLSCTLRVIQPPPKNQTDVNANNRPFLSYAHHDDVGLSTDIPMISVALEVKVKKSTTDDINKVIHPEFKVSIDAIGRIRKIINKATELGGSYYLPYYHTAEIDQFRVSYPKHIKWRAQADIWNPADANGKRAFNNEFLKAHLGT